MKKRVFLLAMFFIALFNVNSQTSSLWDGTTAASYGGGTGSEYDPYLISTAQELAFLAQNVNQSVDYASVYFKLMNNLDLNNLPWTPIGNTDYAGAFNGIFDGNNKTISNLNITTSSTSALFGYFHSSGSISNLGIINGTVTATSDQEGSLRAAALVGYGQGSIQNCYNKGCNISVDYQSASGAYGSGAYAGGIIAEGYGTVKNCFNTGNISVTVNSSNFSVTGYAGGIVGHTYGALSNCYNRGDISSSPWYAGGIAGADYSGTPIANSYNTGTITSAWNQVGAIVASGSSSNSYYLAGTATNASGATEKSIEEMKTAEFVTSLNGGQSPRIWIADHANNVNDGLPILYYQPENGGGSSDQPLWDGTIAASYGGGTGSEYDPYLINTAQELAFLAQNVNQSVDYTSVYFKLMNNLDLNNLSWTPIGNTDYAGAFNGIFDGNNKTISNLNITTNTTSALFGYLHSSGSISNLGIINGNVTATSNQDGSLRAAALVGYGQGSIQNCYNKGCNISVDYQSASGSYGSGAYGGGIIAEGYGTVKNCFNTGNISVTVNSSNFSVTGYAGGIVGHTYGALSNCYNRGDVSSSPWYAGGIAGADYSGKPIANSYNTGTITSAWNQVGAIVANGTTSNSYYLAGTATNASGATEKSSEEMKAAEFVSLLNADQSPAIWIADYTPNLNDGFPIFYYQQADSEEPKGVVITIAESENGAIKVLKDGVEISSGDKVEPGSRLKLVAVPNDNYVLKVFLADNNPIFGYDYEVFTAVELSARFEYSEAVTRWDGTIADSYGGGSGSKNDPYLIYTPQQLALVAQSSLEGSFDMQTYFKLMNNLDLAMFDWTPIGPDQNNTFRAYFDGNHKTIANLYIKNKAFKYAGLFGCIGNVEVKNFGIIGNSSITLNEAYTNAGMIAGVNFGSIVNCYNTGDVAVTNSSYAAGIAGRNSGAIINCYNTGRVQVSSYSYAGGITVENNKTIENCYNIGKIEALTPNSQSGAIATYNTKTVENSYYLTASCQNAGSGVEKTEQEMTSPDFVTTLNNNQRTLPWIADQQPNINNGYPIFKWEVGAIFPITIVQPQNGSVKVFNNDLELKSGDNVKWETKLTFLAIPTDSYIVETFLYDTNKIFGETQIVYDPATVSAQFMQVDDMLRWDGTIATSYGGGNGSEANPYLINTPQQLAYLAQEVNRGIIYENKYFKLTTNIDLCHLEWTPIGIDIANAMTGAFDGRGHLIANIRSTHINAGLFGVVSQVAKEIKNIGVIGVNILNSPSNAQTGDMPCVGTISAINHVKIMNCFAKGSYINSAQSGGGIAGYNFGTINNSYSFNGVNAELYAGGIAGANSGTISNSYSLSDVHSAFPYQNYEGGITGFNNTGFKVTNSYYVKGRGTNVGGGVEKTESEMKTIDFVTSLNSNQQAAVWSTDVEPNINYGFPILKWQDGRQFTITVTQAENGTITPETTILTFGDNETFTITPNKNYHIADVLVDGVSVGAVSKYKFSNVVSDHTITALFAIDQYTITVTQTDNGTITPETINVDHGGSQTFTIVPNTNYEISQLIIDGVTIPAASSYTFTAVTADHTISATFKPLVGVSTAVETISNIYANAMNIKIETTDYIDMSIEIIDLTGRTVSRQQHTATQTSITMQHKGVYIVRLISSDNKLIATQKVVCQ